MSTAGTAPLLVAANRGPVAFHRGPQGLVPRRGGGGLVSGLAAALVGSGAVWVCAPLSPEDREAAAAAPEGRVDLAGHDTGGLAVSVVDVDPVTHDRAYNDVANSTLWYLHHGLFSAPTTPVFDAGWRVGWQAYRDYAAVFAERVAAQAAPGAEVLVQDYHLALVPRLLRLLRPDVAVHHFSHTPWADAGSFAQLPADVARAVCEGVLGADSAGFLSRRWALAFLDCCAAVLGARVDPDRLEVHHEGRTTRLVVLGLGVDADALRARAHQPDVEAQCAALHARVGDRQLLARVDRAELSKNLLRGLAAYRELLHRYPQWQGRVVHVLSVYPSRTDLADYRAYTAQVLELARGIEAEFATPDWSPLVLELADDLPRSLAVLRCADVLLVNPVRDGMNLVAKEGPVLSDRGVALVLSREAGAWDDLAGDAVGVNPFDVGGTAEALHAALSMTADERRRATSRMAATAALMTPAAWLAAQRASLAGAVSRA